MPGGKEPPWPGVPDLLARPLFRTPPGVTLVGVDEETALVGGPEVFTVTGHQWVWVLGDGKRADCRSATHSR
jgi:cyanophycinase